MRNTPDLSAEWKEAENRENNPISEKIAKILRNRYSEKELIEYYEKFIYIKINEEVIDPELIKPILKDQNWNILAWKFKTLDWIWVNFVVLNDVDYCHIITPENKTWL